MTWLLFLDVVDRVWADKIQELQMQGNGLRTDDAKI